MIENVLFLVVDALRADAITPKIAPHFSEIASENVSFDQCVTPANWSLPAHASLFNGDYPHEHGYLYRDHYVESLPLVDSFNERGYRTVGVSANIYASTSHGFANGFDRFYETRRPLNPRGLNPFASVRGQEGGRDPGVREYLRTLHDATSHERPVASLGNFGRAIILETDRRYALRRHLPGVRDDKYGFLTKASARTSDLIVEAFEDAAESDRPLFAFANYMDTHYPYQPPQAHLDAVADGRVDVEDIRAFEPNVSNSRIFLNEYFGDRLDEEVVSLVRSAYEGEVHSVDQRIGDLLRSLDERGFLEETLVVVTADHGDCLGETDLRGERGMGHLDSLNPHLWRVPLILAHPDLENVTVGERRSLNTVFDILTGGLEAFLESGGHERPESDDDDPVLFELPANPHHEDAFDDLVDIPDWYVERESKTHTVVGFSGDWIVAVGSNGDAEVWRDGTQTDVADAPTRLMETSEEAVRAFPSVSASEPRELSEDRIQQLGDLGYL